MSKPAVRVTDPHGCPIHGGGPVLPTCAQNTLFNSLNAARIADSCMCIGPPDLITGGTTETVIEGQGATRETEATAHGGKITRGSPDILIGKVLMARIVIVAGSCWDNAAGRAEIGRQINEAERVTGNRIVTGPYETVNDASLKAIGKGKWNGTNNYSPQAVGQMNSLGGAQQPALLFTDSISGGTTDALTVSHAWAAPADGLQNEGVVYACGSQSDKYVIAHELGHLLSREAGADTHDEVNPGNLMWPYTGGRGDAWTDPWASASEQSPLLR